jgi:hypothetical protein
VHYFILGKCQLRHENQRLLDRKNWIFSRNQVKTEDRRPKTEDCFLASLQKRKCGIVTCSYDFAKRKEEKERNIFMKKLICVLTLLLMASTAIAADVDIDCQVDGTTVTVRAKANGQANRPRGIALDITVNNSASISNVTPISTDYWVYPGTIDINTTTGDVNEYGTPVGASSAGSITIEMGTLHYPADVNSVNAPDHSVWLELLSFDVTEGSGAADVNIVGNALRGKVVKYNANSANVSYTACQVVFVEPAPACWDGTQCHGDIDGDGTVNTTDFFALKDSWFKTYPDASYDPCADFNRDGSVNTTDFFILKDNWFLTVTSDCAIGGTWPPSP